jgi:hypothetical protein
MKEHGGGGAVSRTDASSSDVRGRWRCKLCTAQLLARRHHCPSVVRLLPLESLPEIGVCRERLRAFCPNAFYCSSEPQIVTDLRPIDLIRP